MEVHDSQHFPAGYAACFTQSDSSSAPLQDKAVGEVVTQNAKVVTEKAAEVAKVRVCSGRGWRVG